MSSASTTKGGLLAGDALSLPMEVVDFEEEDFRASAIKNDTGTPYVPPTEGEYLQLLKKINDLEEKVRKMGSAGSDSENSYVSDSNRQVQKKDRHSSENNDSGGQSSSLVEEGDDDDQDRPKRIMLFGQAFFVDESFRWRVKWGQRGAGFSSFLTFVCYLATFSSPKNTVLQALMVFFSVGILFSAITFYKDNIYFEVVKRLFQEARVWIIVVSVILILLIDILKPWNSFSWVFGLIYMVTTLNILLLDAVRKKNRWFVIYCGVIFTLINVLNIYDRIFGTVDAGVILVEYSIGGKKLNFMKRDVKRSMYLNIMLFSLGGIWIMLKDKKMDVMMFANGLIYRVTGEAHNKVGTNKHHERHNSVVVQRSKVLPFMS